MAPNDPVSHEVMTINVFKNEFAHPETSQELVAMARIFGHKL